MNMIYVWKITKQEFVDLCFTKILHFFISYLALSLAGMFTILTILA